MHLYTDKSLHRELVGGFEHFVFFHLLGIIILIDSYFSDGWLNHQPEKLLHRESGQSHLGVFRNGDTPIAGWFMENPIENGWLNRVPLFQDTITLSRRVEPSPNQFRLVVRLGPQRFSSWTALQRRETQRANFEAQWWIHLRMDRTCSTRRLIGTPNNHWYLSDHW